MLAGASVADFKDLPDKKFLYMEKNLTLTQTRSDIFDIEIPQNFVTGEYILSLNANFRDKTIPISTKFQVQSSITNEFLTNNLIYFVLIS